MWEELKQLKLSGAIPIILLGDFNEIRKPEGRKGCTVQSRNMVEFDECINDMELFDMLLMGRKFTWGRGKSLRRLDRVLIHPFWLKKVENLKLRSLSCSISNHIPILLESQVIN